MNSVLKLMIQIDEFLIQIDFKLHLQLHSLMARLHPKSSVFDLKHHDSDDFLTIFYWFYIIRIV